MPDPVTVLVGVGVASGIGACGAGVIAARAHAEMVRLSNPFGEALRKAFDCGDEIPPEMADELKRLD